MVESESARAPAYEDKSSVALAGEETFSYDYLEQMEKKYQRLMSDIAIVEGRLDEVSSLMRSGR